MLFNMTLSVADLQVIPQDDHVVLGLALAVYLPTPQGDIPLPFGVVNVPMSKDMAITKGQELIALDATEGEASNPPPQKKSDLVIAKDLKGVEQVAKMDRQIKGKFTQ